MTTYHHQFRRLGPFIRWTLVQENPPGGVIATGWALTRNRAWDASIAALPPGPPLEKLLEPRVGPQGEALEKESG